MTASNALAAVIVVPIWNVLVGPVPPVRSMPPWVSRFDVAAVVVVVETARDEAVANVSDVSVAELFPFESSAV